MRVDVFELPLIDLDQAANDEEQRVNGWDELGMTYFLVLIEMIDEDVVVFDDAFRSSFSRTLVADLIDVRVSFTIEGAERMSSSFGSSVSLGAYTLPGKSHVGLRALVGKGSPGSVPRESNAYRSNVNAEHRDTFRITLHGGCQNEHEERTMHDDCQRSVW